MQAFFVSRLSSIAVAGALLFASTSEGHHSFAVFDADTEIEIRGVVVDFKLRNPHSSIVLDGLVFVDGVRQGTGVERWEIEADASAPMRTSGIDEQTFQVGDPITVLANPNKQQGFRFARARSLTAKDGEEFLLGFRGSDRVYSPTLQRMLGREQRLTDVAVEGIGINRIAGRWQQPLSGRSAGSVLPLNATGIRARDDYEPSRSPANTCEPINMPELLHAPFFLVDIEISENRAIFKHELYDVLRSIPLDGQAAADPEGLFGIASGRIDDNALVVESHDYPPSGWGLGIATQPLGGGADVPSSSQKSVVERYTLSSNGQTLIVDYRVEDPTYLERPYDGHLELTRVPDSTAIYPYRCDPESAAMWSRSAGDTPLRVGP